MLALRLSIASFPAPHCKAQATEPNYGPDHPSAIGAELECGCDDPVCDGRYSDRVEQDSLDLPEEQLCRCRRAAAGPVNQCGSGQHYSGDQHRTQVEPALRCILRIERASECAESDKAGNKYDDFHGPNLPARNYTRRLETAA